MTKPQREKDLFEAIAPAEAGQPGDVERIMVVVRESDKAWLLRRADRRDAEPQWAPKSRVQRGEFPDDDIFRIPRWLAEERGWL